MTLAIFRRKITISKYCEILFFENHEMALNQAIKFKNNFPLKMLEALLLKVETTPPPFLVTSGILFFWNETRLRRR